MKRLVISAALLGVAIALVAVSGAVSPAGHAGSFNYGHMNKIQKRLASSSFTAALAPASSPCVNPTDGGEEGDEADNECPPDSYASPSGTTPSNTAGYSPSSSGDCSERLGDNIKVNQNCQNVSDPDLSGRGQAQNETSIAIDPNNPNHVIASQNDYRRGDGNCYGAYSLDGGKNWGDTTIPMSFTRGNAFGGAAREYWQSGGDTSVAWDTKGNAYFSCQVFNRGGGVSPNQDQSSAFYVFRSTGNNGASWNFPGRPVTEHADLVGAGNVLEDKQLLTVDDHNGSPFQDRVYVTWTEFAADGTGYIWESYSSDYGEHFSPRHIVSADSPLCTNTYGIATPQGRCNENQWSVPFTGPDGALYVAWANYNNAVRPGDNRNQILIAKSVDGGNTFSTPIKVSDYYDLPDCLTYQGSDPGRACVPEKGPTRNSVFRATNYPAGSVDPTNPKRVVVTLGSYINKDSNESNGCVPAGLSPATGQNLFTGVKTPGACNNDILISVSTDGGATFSGTATDPRVEETVNPDAGQALSDQFWQWTAFNKQGKLAVSYYDRQYGRSVGGTSSTPAVPSDEYTGYSDITLSGSRSLTSWGTSRVTSDSMPPPTQFGGQFYGDYSGLDADTDALPYWMDTRDPELFPCPGSGPPEVCLGSFGSGPGAITANDENGYTASVGIPGK